MRMKTAAKLNILFFLRAFLYGNKNSYNRITAMALADQTAQMENSVFSHRCSNNTHRLKIKISVSREAAEWVIAVDLNLPVLQTIKQPVITLCEHLCFNNALRVESS